MELRWSDSGGLDGDEEDDWTRRARSGLDLEAAHVHALLFDSINLGSNNLISFPCGLHRASMLYTIPIEMIETHVKKR